MKQLTTGDAKGDARTAELLQRLFASGGAHCSAAPVAMHGFDESLLMAAHDEPATPLDTVSYDMVGHLEPQRVYLHNEMRRKVPPPAAAATAAARKAHQCLRSPFNPTLLAAVS